MGEYSTIMARDGHEFQAWLAAPPGRPRGAVVVIQEIFGVNGYIRKVTDDYAAQGYTAIAPCLFDRVRRGIELGYTPAEAQEGSGYLKQLTAEMALRDIAAARAVVKHSGRAASVGFCWGGTLSYLAAGELPLACAVVYYGKLADHLDHKPKCPVMYHFGSQDASIPLRDIELLKAAYPQAPVYVYRGAAHGFSCDQRPTYDPQAAAQARVRTLEFIGHYVAGGAPVSS